VRERRAESVSVIGSPTPFEATPLIPGTSPDLGGGKLGHYGSFVSESPKA